VFGCDSNIVTNISVQSINTTVNQFNNSFTANETNASYQWISCNPYSILVGDTSQSYTPTTNGEYAVIILIIFITWSNLVLQKYN